MKKYWLCCVVLCVFFYKTVHSKGPERTGLSPWTKLDKWLHAEVQEGGACLKKNCADTQCVGKACAYPWSVPLEETPATLKKNVAPMFFAQEDADNKKCRNLIEAPVKLPNFHTLRNKFALVHKDRQPQRTILSLRTQAKANTSVLSQLYGLESTAVAYFFKKQHIANSTIFKHTATNILSSADHQPRGSEKMPQTIADLLNNKQSVNQEEKKETACFSKNTEQLRQRPARKRKQVFILRDQSYVVPKKLK